MKKINKVHFIGIGGIGVSALAKYYLTKGWQVSGSDLVSSEITDSLKKLGAEIRIGKHRTENLPKDANLAIYSPAVQKSNPELKSVFTAQLRVLSYPEALGELTKKYFTIAVTGTHGKSTTSSILGLLLTKAGLDPTVIVGTKLKEFSDSNCRVAASERRASRQRRGSPEATPKGRGKSPEGKLSASYGARKYLVIEADEHFASFLNYWPKIIVLTRLEADHLDYFKNFKNYLSAFKKFVSHLPEDGVLVANKDDKNIRQITSNRRQETRIIDYSLKQSEAKKLRRILKVPGEHNVSNALAALKVARVLKIPDRISFKALSEYRGSWRRFDEKTIKLKAKRYKLISDYAHHPTEIKATLQAAREKYPKKQIWCIYQPHQYQRTYYLFNDFVKVFKNSPVDRIIITDIYDVAGRENKEIKKKVNSEKLVKAVNKNSVIYLPKDKILTYLKKNMRNGEILIIMGAGDIYELSKQF